MKNYIPKKLLVITAIFLVVVMAASFSSRSVTVVAAANPVNGCALTATEFNSWFQSGSVSLNGRVKHFVSREFPNSQSTPDCVFFKWSEQTFLWLTSPLPSHPADPDKKYSSIVTNRVFESPAFYDVSPPGADGKRSLTPHESGKITVFTVRDAQVGPDHLQVTFEKKTGRMLEVEKTPMSAKGLPLILNKAGVQTEITNISFDIDGKPLFIDKSGKIIQSPRPFIQKKSNTKSVVHKYLSGGKYVFLDASGNYIEVEDTQADGGVLMSQNNSLVYYSIMVNQRYAYFHSLERTGAFEGTFDFFGRRRNEVAEYAAAHGETILYPDMAPMEIKCSWVEASSLPDASTYIKMKASIPTYNKSAEQWIPIGQQTVELALVGMHIVGNATDWWPDMFWTTFEHINNTPNAAYSYNKNTNSSTLRPFVDSVPQNTSGTWNFCSDGSTGPFNVSRMHIEGNKIVANSGTSIGPSNIIRWKPWGSGSNRINAEIKAINNSVMSLLMDGDLRKNYVQVGTTWRTNTWSTDGQGPRHVIIEDKGSSRLANSTMETYIQGTSNSITTGTTCFSCHIRTTFDGGGDDDLKTYSHIYYSLKPLFNN